MQKQDTSKTTNKDLTIKIVKYLFVNRSTRKLFVKINSVYRCQDQLFMMSELTKRVIKSCRTQPEPWVVRDFIAVCSVYKRRRPTSRRQVGQGVGAASTAAYARTPHANVLAYHPTEVLYATCPVCPSQHSTTLYTLQTNIATDGGEGERENQPLIYLLYIFLLCLI